MIPLRVRCLVTLPWAAAGPRDFEPERPRVVLVRALPPDGDRAGDLPLAEAACAGRDGTPAGAGVPCRDVVAGGLLAGDQRRTVHLSRCHRAFGLPQTHSAKEGVEIVCRVEIDWSEAGQVTLGAVRAFHPGAPLGRSVGSEVLCVCLRWAPCQKPSSCWPASRCRKCPSHPSRGSGRSDEQGRHPKHADRRSSVDHPQEHLQVPTRRIHSYHLPGNPASA